MDVDREFFWMRAIFGALFAILFAVIGYELLHPDFTLKKDEWICTCSKTSIVYQWNGKTGYPAAVKSCQTWQRKGSF